MKYFSKLIIQTVMFSSALLFNSIAISNEYDFLCTGKQVITTPKNTIDNETTIQIIIRNNRLFIPGMMLLCSKKNNTYNCIKKRLDSRWQAKLDISKELFWYRSHNVSQNKTQEFFSSCQANQNK